ncbi:MAG: hypothetical protein NT007_04950 [Candidatus Kapabacteria bacterium]|nr:hypothetical protein [Candidatus Kapabacteria bacterium]
MRKYSLILGLLFLLCINKLSSQTYGIYSFQQADSMKISFDKLGKKYKFVQDSNFFDAKYFKDSVSFKELRGQDWSEFIQSLQMNFLDNHFKWQGKVTILLQVYSNKNGKLDYIFFKSNSRDFQETKEFRKILKEFYRKFKFKMKYRSGFVHSGGINLG